MRINIKELEPFDENHNAKLFKHFCWDIDYYLECLNGSSDKAKVNIAVMFLIGTTKFWWRNRVEDLDVERIVLLLY